MADTSLEEKIDVETINALTYRMKHCYQVRHDGELSSTLITCVDIHPNGKSFYTGAEDGTIYQWNLYSGWRIKKFQSG